MANVFRLEGVTRHLEHDCQLRQAPHERVHHDRAAVAAASPRRSRSHLRRGVAVVAEVADELVLDSLVRLAILHAAGPRDGVATRAPVRRRLDVRLVFARLAQDLALVRQLRAQARVDALEVRERGGVETGAVVVALRIPLPARGALVGPRDVLGRSTVEQRDGRVANPIRQRTVR